MGLKDGGRGRLGEQLFPGLEKGSRAPGTISSPTHTLAPDVLRDASFLPNSSSLNAWGKPRLTRLPPGLGRYCHPEQKGQQPAVGAA